MASFVGYKSFESRIARVFIEVFDLGAPGFWLKASDKSGSAMVFVAEALPATIAFSEKASARDGGVFSEAVLSVGRVGLYQNNKTSEIDLFYSGGAAVGGGHTIQDEGSDLTQRTNLNFTGAGVSVSDDSGNDATVVAIAGDGGGSTETYPFRAIKNSNQVVADPSGGALITWDAEAYDPDNVFDVANDKFVAPVDGIYLFGVNLFFDYTGDANDHPLWAQLSDGVGLYCQVYHSLLAANKHRVNASRQLKLDAGEEVFVSFSGTAVECTLDVADLGGALPDFCDFHGMLVKDLTP